MLKLWEAKDSALNNNRKPDRPNDKRGDWPRLIVGIINHIVGTSKYYEAEEKYREAQDRASRRTASATVWMANPCKAGGVSLAVWGHRLNRD